MARCHLDNIHDVLFGEYREIVCVLYAHILLKNSDSLDCYNKIFSDEFSDDDFIIEYISSHISN